MRSSKSRSRSKSNRPRTLGNITNRVFDSSGPEGKVRGTPQQIIEKYLFLARDAQLSNDRVNAENFQQHAEHYTRMLSEAQREMAAEQEQRRQQEQQNQPRDRQDRGDRNDGQQADSRNDQRNDQRGNDQREFRNEDRRDRRADRNEQTAPTGNDVIDLAAQDDDNGLVETPEARRPSRSRPAKPAGAEPVSEAVSDPVAAVADTQQSETNAGERTERGPRRPRGPRKPKPAEAGGSDPGTSDPRAAAE